MRSSLGPVIVRILAVIVSLAGLWISYELTAQHLKIPRDQKGVLEEACTVFETSSCEKVSDSQWGRFPFGAGKDEFQVPTAELGLAYFTFIFFWFLLIGTVSPPRRWVHLLVTGVATVGLITSIYLDFVMFTELDYWCPLCLASHIGSLLIFCFALLLWPGRPKTVVSEKPADRQDRSPAVPQAAAAEQIRGRKQDWPHWWMIIVTPIIVVLAIFMQHFQLNLRVSESKLENEKKRVENWEKKYKIYDSRWQHTYMAWQLTKPVNIDIKDTPFRGAENARHTAVIFSDFTCSACKPFEEWFYRVIFPLGEKDGSLKVVFKHWPISTDCNTQATTNLHPNACKAAYAAEAAYIVGGNEAFWKMHDLLFDRQHELKELPVFEVYAREIGLDEQAFLKAMNSDEVKQRIKNSILEGMSLGEDLVKQGKLKKDGQEWIKVESTPAIFVDNKRLNSPVHVMTWKTILRLPALKQPQTRPAVSDSRSPATADQQSAEDSENAK